MLASPAAPSAWTPPVRRDRDVAILAMAAGVGLVGFLLGWLVRRGWSPLGSVAGALPPGGNGGHVTNIWNIAPGATALPSGSTWMPPPAALPSGIQDLGSSVNHDTRFSTVTVQSTATLIYSTPADRYYKVQIRVISPPGSFIMVAPESSTLTNATPAGGGGGMLVIPAGGWNEIRLKPRQQLYAKGNVASVVVSLTAAPEVSTNP